MEISKELLIDAIIGVGFKSYKIAEKMTANGFAEFSGNQWNEEWSYRKDKLLELTFYELELVYKLAKGI